MDDAGPRLWMTVSDVFRLTGRGTVITGQLEGDGQLMGPQLSALAPKKWRWRR